LTGSIIYQKLTLSIHTYNFPAFLKI